MATKAHEPDLELAETILTAFARSQLKAWLARYAPRLNRRRRLVAKRACKTVVVSFDHGLPEADPDCNAYMYFARPLRISMATDADEEFPSLVNHELAHFICILRWRDGGHGRRFTMTVNQLTQEGL